MDRAIDPPAIMAGKVRDTACLEERSMGSREMTEGLRGIVAMKEVTDDRKLLEKRRSEIVVRHDMWRVRFHFLAGPGERLGAPIDVRVGKRDDLRQTLAAIDEKAQQPPVGAELLRRDEHRAKFCRREGA